MGKIYKNGIAYSGTIDVANDINYNNTNSNLNATNVQDAIDEVNSSLIPKEVTDYTLLNNCTLLDAQSFIYEEPYKATICLRLSKPEGNFGGVLQLPERLCPVKATKLYSHAFSTDVITHVFVGVDGLIHLTNNNGSNISQSLNNIYIVGTIFTQIIDG